MRSSAAWLAGCLAMASVLAACGGGMPDSGRAGAGRDVGGVQGEPLGVAPVGPRPGAGPEEIVGGFLHAAAGFDDDHAVARSFLYPTIAPQWRPGQGTVIYPDDKTLSVTASGTGAVREVVVTAPVWGRIDESGRLSLAPAGSSASASFRVTSQGGQWRIDQLGNDFGMWMPQYEFDRAYTPVRLSFVANGSRIIVPDLRWFAGTRPAVATAVVRTLLRGPPDYLKGAVTTGAPLGTSLGVDAVPATGGSAQVDLSAAALGASPDDRQMLWAQLSVTLRQLPTVSSISITVEGSAYPVAGITSGAASDSDLGFTDDVRVEGPVLVLGGDKVKRVDVGSGQLATTSVGQFSHDFDASGLRSIAAGPEPNVLVGVDTSGTRLLSMAPSAERVTLLRGADLLSPTIDRTGWVWTADRGSVGTVVVGPATSATATATATKMGSKTLAPQWLADRRVNSLDVSRDGARLAVVSIGKDGSARLDVAGIVRDKDGRPTSLAEAEPAGQSLSGIREVSWADRTNLAVLAGSRGGLQPYQVEVGGSVTALPKAPDAIAVWAGDGLRAVYLATSSGTILERSGNDWRTLGPGVSVTIGR